MQQITNPDADGELVIRTLAMPSDTNANGDIFGGWLLSQMDLGGGILAKRRARSRIATVAITAMSFLNAVHVGDVVCCYAKIIKEGRTSMTIKIQAWTSHPENGTRLKVTEGEFIYVAIDQQGKPQSINQADRK